MGSIQTKGMAYNAMVFDAIMSLSYGPIQSPETPNGERLGSPFTHEINTRREGVPFVVL